MDSSRHHNPYAPEGANAMNEFPAARWSRAGATEDEIAVLSEEHAALPVAEQAGIVGWTSSVSDDDLAAVLAERREAEPDGFVSAVGSDADDATTSDEHPHRGKSTQRGGAARQHTPTDGADSGGEAENVV